MLVEVLELTIARSGMNRSPRTRTSLEAMVGCWWCGCRNFPKRDVDEVECLPGLTWLQLVWASGGVALSEVGVCGERARGRCPAQHAVVGSEVI